MFTQSVPAPTPAPSSPGLHVASPSSPASPTRPSRLRGLSYLRSYTQNHLLNRDQHGPSSPGSPGGSSGPSPASAALSAVAHASSIQSSHQPSHHHSSSTSGANSSNHSSQINVRGVSPPPLSPADAFAPLLPSQSAPTPGPSITASGHRFSLVPAASHPLGTSPTDPSSPTDAFPPLPTTHDPYETQEPAAVAAVPAYLAHGQSVLENSNTSSAPPPPSAMTRSRSATDSGINACAPAGVGAAAGVETLPSIRFSTFYDPRSTRPSLKFTPMSRTLPTGKEVIRVGRYSERDSQPPPTPNVPSAAHVGFKSKVVSRRHCEFWFENNRWYIKDVKSSSGTFLNHIRLSQPGTESKPFPINDGDIVQLGIDFKGGEEMIFRCVKMRVELNRGWQNKINAFNLNTHKRLRNLTKTEGDSSTQSSQDCSICLNSIAPCQSLFVAPCSHTWHYKCIRSLLESAQYPSFNCPNCRAAVDLEADVEDPPEEWEKMETEEAFEGVPEEHIQEGAAVDRTNGVVQRSHAETVSAPMAPGGLDTPDLADVTMADDPMHIDTAQPPLGTNGQSQSSLVGGHTNGATNGTISQQQLPEQAQAEQEQEPDHTVVSHATSSPVPIPANAGSLGRTPGSATATTNGISSTIVNLSSAARDTRTPSPSGAAVPNGHEGPITPRNDAGPWVFDGSGIRIGSGRASTESRRGEMRSLDTAAAEMAGQFNT